MTLINLKDLSVTLSEPLFSGLTFALAKTERVGLVAANGRGKSTLLKVMAGQIEPTGGEITWARNSKVGWVSQDVPDSLRAMTLYDAVCDGLDADQRENEVWRADIALDDLQVPPDIWGTEMSALSGGWQRVALLARIWVGEPDVLLLDEPTNHLDLSRIGVLQDWLSSVARNVGLLVASHDRAFLDEITERTIFLRADAPRDYALPFSQARDALAQSDAADARVYENQLAKANQLRKQAAKLKNVGINSGSDLLLTKTKQLTERAAKIEGAARPGHDEKSAGKIRLSNSGTHSKALVSIDETEVTAPDGRVLFRAGPLWINRGDRVVILGANGAGKTCLVTRLISAFSEEDAAIKVTPSVVPGISDQSLSQLEAFNSAFDAVVRSSDIGDRNARSLLAGAGLRVALQDGPIGQLSGGQKARLAMALLRLQRPNFYVLDEPTNHLDIEGQETLEWELLDHEVTTLLVSHDRMFVRHLGTRFWQIVRKRLVEVDDPEAFFSEQLAR